MQKKWLCLIAVVGLLGGNVLGANGEEWKQVFADAFDRIDLFGADWVGKSGKWDMRGQLKGNGPGAVIMCTRRFQVPLRIEYECSSDNPGDLSIQFNASLDKQMICYVGFGCEFNTKNKICTPAGDVVVSKDNLIETGRRHRVVVVATETNVTQSIDGKETLKADIKFPMKGVYFGFNIWTVGAFANVKVYSPHEAVTGKVEEARSSVEKAENPVREFKSFEDWPMGSMAATNCTVACGEKCSVKIADMPTWLYYNLKDEFRGYKENEEPEQAKAMMAASQNKGPRLVSDRCVELVSEDASGKGKAVITFPMPAMRNGMVEFDLLADQYAGDALRVRLGDKAGLFIDKDGTFYWESGANRLKLTDRITYKAIGGSGRFYLWPQRWYTVRIEFDASLSLASVAIVNMFHSCHRSEGDRYGANIDQFYSVGEDLPLPLDAVTNLSFETACAGRFYVDNLFFINRTPELADDLKWRVQAREIMPVYYHQRKDPPTLKTWSLRNLRNTYGGAPTGDEMGDLSPEKYPVILESAKQYNKIVIDQAFLAEKLRGLERAYFYLGAKSGELAGKYAEQMTQARKSVAETEALLAQLYRFYAECYLDSLNQAKMKEGFASRHEALKLAIAKNDTLIQSAYGDMISKVAGKAGPIACQYEQRPETEWLTYSEGSHRLNGKREFLFLGGGDLQPYMYKYLLLPGYGGAPGDYAMDAREPAYCDTSTNSHFYRSASGEYVRDAQRVTSMQMTLRFAYGLWSHSSTLPMWWVEKHKADPDIHLRNMKGEVTLDYGTNSPQQPFNYWNQEVLAAQKAYLQGLVDALTGFNKDWPKRVFHIQMAMEAMFFISAPGGMWETGYNKTAVKAFQEQLKKQYGSIGVLNERWGSKYGSFDEIQPPADFCVKPRTAPSGLAYEFERFRMKSWSDWQKQCHRWVLEKLPDKNTPNSCDISYPILSCQDSVDGLDMVKLFETFNIVMEHYQLRFAQDTGVYRYLENLRQAFKSSTGIGEWYAGGPGEIFDEQAVQNDMLRMTFQQVQWGRNVLVYWLNPNFLENGAVTDRRLGHTVFRYYGTFVPLGIARVRAHQAIFLECPLVDPDVGVMESETSFYNVTGVRGGVGEYAGLLSSKGHDFGFLFERLIMDGRQKLDNYKVLILPNALSLPADFTQKILAWVEKGGTLITTGPVGLWNEYGQTNGLILDKVIGKGNWSCEGRIFKLKENLPDTAACKVAYRKEMSFLVEGQLGKGKVFIRHGSLPADMLYGFIAASAPRQFYGEGNKFHLAMRDDAKGVAGKAGTLYLSILNPDCYQTLEDEIVVKGEYKDVADISCNFPITTTIKDGYTRFKVKLAPAEGVMIRIGK